MSILLTILAFAIALNAPEASVILFGLALWFWDWSFNPKEGT